jgi:hypothetical protein
MEGERKMPVTLVRLGAEQYVSDAFYMNDTYILKATNCDTIEDWFRKYEGEIKDDCTWYVTHAMYDVELPKTKEEAKMKGFTPQRLFALKHFKHNCYLSVLLVKTCLDKEKIEEIKKRLGINERIPIGKLRSMIPSNFYKDEKEEKRCTWILNHYRNLLPPTLYFNTAQDALSFILTDIEGHREKEEGTCATCGTRKPLTVMSCCSGTCFSENDRTYYCNRECQRKHWREHKVTCHKSQT